MELANMGADDGDGKGDIAQTAKKGRRIEAVFLSIVYTTITTTHLSKWMIYFLTVCDGLQLLHFSWKKQYMLGDSPGTFFSSIGGITMDYSTFQALFYVTFAIVLFNVIGIIAVGALLHRGQFRSVWPLKFLRIASLMVKTVLLVPITNIFVSGVHCNYGTGNLVLFPDQACFSDNYIGSIIGLCIVIPYSLITPVTLLDAQPSTEHFLGTQAQGQTDAVYSALRMALVFLHVFATGSDVPAIGLIGNIVLFGYLLYEYLATLPYYAFTLNRIRASSLIAVVLSSISATITYSILADETSALIAQITTTSIGYLIGSISPTIARQRITQTVYARIKEEIDSKGASSNSSKEAVSKLASKPPSSQKAQEIARDDASFLLQSSKINQIASTRTVKRPPIFQRETDVEIACRFVRHNNTVDGRGLMHYIFRYGLQQYPKSAFLHATYAFYAHKFDSGKDRQAQQLVRSCSSQLKAKFTDRVLLFFIERSLESALRPKGSDDDNGFSISSFAEYQSLEASARQFHTQTLEELRGFWGYLASATVTARALPVFAQRVLYAELKGDEYYAKLVSRFPKSKVMLRMYATWLRQVKNDPESAKEYFELADQIENKEMNERAQNIKDASVESLVEVALDQDDNFDDVKDEKQKNISYGPALNLMKNASRSLVLSSNFNLHDSNLNFSTLPATTTPDTADNQGTIQDPTAHSLPKQVDEPLMEDVKMEISGEKDNEKLRRAAFLEPESIPVNRISSERTVMISDSDLESESQDREKELFAIGPRSESNASSSASTKALRMKRVQKAQLEIRLTSEIRTFGLRVIVLNLSFLALVIATYIVSAGQFSSFDAQLGNLKISTRLGFRMIQLSLLLREQMLTAQANDEAGFQVAKLKYLGELSSWQTDALPFLQLYYNNPTAIRGFITQYPNGTGEYVWLNEFNIGTSLYQNALQLDLTMEEFADPSIMTNNEYRFFGVPNILALGGPIDTLSNINQASYIVMSGNSMGTLYALIAVLSVAVFAAGAGLFYPMINRSNSTQVKVMKLFMVLPKKACRHIYTNIEEDLENFIATGGDQEIQMANEAKMRVSSVTTAGDISSQGTSKKFLQIFAIWLCAILFSTLAVFIPPVLFELDGVKMVKTINWSDSRRYKIGSVLRISTELACRDDESFMEFHNENEIVATLKDSINVLVDYNLLVTTDHGGSGVKMDVPPLAQMSFIQDITSIPGTCLLGPTLCDPANRVYNSSIGLTEDIVISGLDNLLESFISSAKRFAGMPPASLDIHNRYYQFMRLVMEDLRSGLSMVVDRLVANQADASIRYKTIMTVLFPIAMLVVACSYVAFRTVVRNRTLEMHQIIQLLFSIPYTMLEDSPQLSQYIQSGGVMGLED